MTSGVRSYRVRSWLEQKYWAEGLSTRQVAKLAGVEKTTINVWLRKLGVKIKTFADTRDSRSRHQAKRKQAWWAAHRGLFGGPDSPWRGRVVSEETKRLLAEVRRQWWIDHPDYHPGEETRQKLSLSKLGRNNPNWSGGATRTYYRNLLERTSGIKIPPGILLHHKDGNSDNNSLSNLILVNRSSHRRIHINMRNQGPERGVLCLRCM